MLDLILERVEWGRHATTTMREHVASELIHRHDRRITEQSTLVTLSDIRTHLMSRHIEGAIESPIKGASGNIEYLVHAVYEADQEA